MANNADIYVFGRGKSCVLTDNLSNRYPTVIQTMATDTPEKKGSLECTGNKTRKI